ncbi:MAG: hypothetical protein DRJ40_03225 [Thermoprotei archaeon]|nr:MAG: hypothetical protein DRJ40_03225 [Thermoprotei archaeon]
MDLAEVIRRFRLMYFLLKGLLNLAKRNVVITHRDVDGVIAGALLLRYFGDSEVIFAGPRDIDQVLRIVSLWRGKGYHIAISDISLNRGKVGAVVSSLVSLRKRGCRIYWFDHHTWPEEVLSTISPYVDKLCIERAPSATSVVAKYLNLVDEYTKELIEVANDADTARYSLEVSHVYRRLTQKHGTRIRLLKALARGIKLSNELLEEAKRIEARERKVLTDVAKFIEVHTTRGGRKFIVVDFRGTGIKGAGILVKEFCERYGADFAVVIYRDDSVSLYAGRARDINLLPVVWRFGGGGHPVACGCTLKLPLRDRLMAVIAKIFRRRYYPQKILELIDYTKEVL